MKIKILTAIFFAFASANVNAQELSHISVAEMTKMANYTCDGLDNNYPINQIQADLEDYLYTTNNVSVASAANYGSTNFVDDLILNIESTVQKSNRLNAKRDSLNVIIAAVQQQCDQHIQQLY